MKILFASIFFISGLLGLLLSIYVHRNEPIQPPTKIHSPVSFVKQITGDPKAGEKIFKEFCRSCHDKTPIINVNAPRINDKEIWQIKSKQGINVLLQKTITGEGAMPARGGCFECSDEQLREAIRYLINAGTK